MPKNVAKIQKIIDELGFEFMCITNVGCWYVENYTHRHHRSVCNKRNNTNSIKSETEIIIDIGYDIIWDCGQLKYKLNFN